MAVVPRETKGGTVYWVVTKGHYERIGGDKREADRVNARRKKEVKAGTFVPHATGAVTVRTYLQGWLDALATRSARVWRSMIKNHILEGREWFVALKMEDVEPNHIQRLVDEIKATTKLAPKMVSNVSGALRAAFRTAERQGVIRRNVYLLAPKTLSVKTKKRIPYRPEEVRALLATSTGQRRVWICLAFYTGMRCGEVCGRRWRDWDPSPVPLGALAIESQYNDQPLKTDVPRVVPVHPVLAAVLAEWWAVGFELEYCRKPTKDDFIVPGRPLTNRLLKPLTNSGAYKAWERDCARAAVTNRTQHATRHTFVTETRRGGADTEVVEIITHNASAKVIDTYTHRNWEELCKVVMCLPTSWIPGPNRIPGLVAASHESSLRNDSCGGKSYALNIAGDSSELRLLEPKKAFAEHKGNGEFPAEPATLAASKDAAYDERDPLDPRPANVARGARLQTLAVADFEQAAPGLAACRALDAAYSGDAEATESALTTLAEALGAR